MAQIGHRFLPKGALGLLDVQLVLLECLEHNAQVLKVSAPRRAIYQYIVKEHQHKLPEEGPENVILDCLKGGWCVGDTKRHDQEFIEVLVCLERRLCNIFSSHENLMIPGA